MRQLDEWRLATAYEVAITAANAIAVNAWYGNSGIPPPAVVDVAPLELLVWSVVDDNVVTLDDVEALVPTEVVVLDDEPDDVVEPTEVVDEEEAELPVDEVVVVAGAVTTKLMSCVA